MTIIGSSLLRLGRDGFEVVTDEELAQILEETNSTPPIDCWPMEGRAILFSLVEFFLTTMGFRPEMAVDLVKLYVEKFEQHRKAEDLQAVLEEEYKDMPNSDALYRYAMNILAAVEPGVNGMYKEMLELKEEGEDDEQRYDERPGREELFGDCGDD